MIRIWMMRKGWDKDRWVEMIRTARPDLRFNGNSTSVTMPRQVNQGGMCVRKPPVQKQNGAEKTVTVRTPA